MARFEWKQDDVGVRRVTRPARLESPPISRFANQVSSHSLIGRKLGVIYDVPPTCTDAIETLLGEIDRKLS